MTTECSLWIKATFSCEVIHAQETGWQFGVQLCNMPGATDAFWDFTYFKAYTLFLIVRSTVTILAITVLSVRDHILQDLPYSGLQMNKRLEYTNLK